MQKKLGDVLRSMDRGIMAADTVVTYLFLYLAPTIVQCFVVFAVFYVKFSLRALASLAFLSPSSNPPQPIHL